MLVPPLPWLRREDSMHLFSRFWLWLLARPLRQLLWLNLLAMALIGVLGWIAPHPGALRLETCYYESTFRAIVGQWTRAGRFTFVAALAVDFVFPFFYAAGLRKLYETWCAWLGFEPLRSIRSLPVLAGGFDLVENTLTLAALLALRFAATPLGPLVALVAMAALVKFALLFVVGLAFVVAFFQSRWGWAFSTCRFGFVSALLGGLPLLGTSQGQDLLRIVADRATGRVQWSFALFALVAWAASVWYWSRVLLMIRWDTDPEEEEPGAKRILEWLPRLLGTVPILLLALAFYRTHAGDARLGPALLGHAAGSLALAALFLLVVIKRRDWFDLPRHPLRVSSWKQLPRTTQALALAAVSVSALLLVLFTSWSVPVGRTLGAVALVFAFSAHVAFAGSLAVFLERVWSVRLVVLALVCAAFFSRFNDNHALRLLEGGDLDRRPPLAKAFEAWAKDRLEGWPEEKPLPVFLVAAEGGGIRAAYWAAVVLGRLTDRHPAFARQVFAISGVSGGSVGAATYVSLLRDREHLANCRPSGWRDANASDPGVGLLELCAQQVLRQDFLSPVVAKIIAPEFLQWFLPFPVPIFDRSRALEGSFADGYRRVLAKGTFAAATFDAPFSSAWPRCAASPCEEAPVFALPALLLNGTHVKTGRRMLHAPLVWTQKELPEVIDLATLLQADVRLSTAAHDSARFAYVSPAGRLLSASGQDHDHVVDGGYFENSGAATLQDILHVLHHSGYRDRLRFVVLYLCNSAGRCWEPDARADPEKVPPRPPDLTELFAPVRALLGARDARGELALAEISRTPERTPFVEFGTCPGDPTQRQAPEPLGWQLSEGMRVRLSQQAAGGAQAPGNLISDACVRQLLEGEANPPDCERRLPRKEACAAPVAGVP
jgi:hypothetical protein